MMKIFGIAFVGLLLIGTVLALSGDAEPQESAATISDFENALREAGFVVGERRQMRSSIIGAVDGYRFDVNGDPIEVYRYDLSVTTGRDAHERILRDGWLGKPVLPHGPLVLMEAGGRHPMWDDIIATFQQTPGN